MFVLVEFQKVNLSHVCYCFNVQVLVFFFFFILISKYCCSIVRTSLKELESKSIIAISFLHSPQTILHDSGSSQPQPLYSQMKARFLSRTGKALESSSHPLFSEEWDRLNIFQLQQKPSRVMSECGMVKSRGRQNGQDCSEKGVLCMLLTVEVPNNYGIFRIACV